MNETQSPVAEFNPADYIAAQEAARHYPVPCHRATAFRHMLTGVARGGERVRLKTLVVGGRRFTTRQWIAEFVATLNRDNPTQQSPAAMTPVRRQRQARAAMDQLAAMGVSSPQ